MAYVVTDACINCKHTNCVDVCPVNAFREDTDTLYIDPKACIDCNACVSECPEKAIFPEHAVPIKMHHCIDLNATKAKQLPTITESIGSGELIAPSLAAYTGRFAVVGSGPAGFYSTQELLKKMPLSKVDMFDKLPTPFGLVRYGVAPDHPKFKAISKDFELIADNPRFTFYGNVDVGNDVSCEELTSQYDGVIYATGGAKSRALSIPGYDAKNVFDSSRFVGWYNGHPEQRDLQADLSGSRAVVIGIGNVALDIARLMLLDTEQLNATDMADFALEHFINKNIEEVTLVARRGPKQASFTSKELAQICAIKDLDIVLNVDSKLLESELNSLSNEEQLSEVQQNLALLKDIEENSEKRCHKSANKTLNILFLHSPETIEENKQQRLDVNLVKNDINIDEQGNFQIRPGETKQTISADIVVHAIGYQGIEIPGMEFDGNHGVIPNENGRIALNGDSGQRGNAYVAGWIKRGAQGVIGSNKLCAKETVEHLIEDIVAERTGAELTSSELPGSKMTAGAKGIGSILKERHIDYVSFSDWQLLDEYEQTQGRMKGRARSKVIDKSEMLAIIARLKEQEQKNEEIRLLQPVKTHLRNCNLCEAMCGVQIQHQGDKILSISGDPDDSFSKGHICPKGFSLQDLHNDPDRLRTPLEKVNGRWIPISWEDALDKASIGLAKVLEKYGNDAVASYTGNPGSHNFGILTSLGKLRKAIGSKNIFSGASLDQMPHQLMSYLMFGHANLMTIPDLDRTQYMLMIGANPAASNGSLMTAGDIIGRLQGIVNRGGQFVLVDPRKTETAQYATEHQFIKPGTDALFLIGLIQHIINNALFDPAHLKPFLKDYAELLDLFNGFSLKQISDACGISEQDIVRIAQDFANAPGAICYGRMGISTQQFSALNHWLINVLNIITGNLDRSGGMMFSTPACDMSLRAGAAGSFQKYGSRVRNLPEFTRELPTATMVEEMLTPGEGQIKGFLCVAGNPALSNPNGNDVDEALENLDFMVSVDFYLNETSRHANIILPPTGALEHEQFDLVFNTLAVRDVAKYAEPLFKPKDGQLSDGKIIQALTQRINLLKMGKPLEETKPTVASEQILDFALQDGPYGKGFKYYESGEEKISEQGLTLELLKKFPHGIDLGPLKPRLPQHLFTADKLVHMIPEQIRPELSKLQSACSKLTKTNELMLISRRDLRTNNSWMHNSQRLVKGKNRCTLMIHPHDAAEKGIVAEQMIKVRSRVGELQVEAQISEDVMPGVVCMPHGWGHDKQGIGLQVAQANAGVNVNIVTDDQDVDGLSGNAIFNGVPVSVIA